MKLTKLMLFANTAVDADAPDATRITKTSWVVLVNTVEVKAAIDADSPELPADTARARDAQDAV